MIHMYSSICDVGAYLKVAERHGIALLEDASQAHGASWGGNRIGSFGTISVFSTQQSKLLTSGEGGLCVTDDPVLYSRLQQLRADGRQYRADPFHLEAWAGDLDQSFGVEAQNAIAPDGYELEAVGDLAGQNLCITEFQAALLLEGLDRLDRENAYRRSCVEALDSSLESLEAVKLIIPSSDVDRPTFYRLAMRDSPDAFAGLSAHQLVPALAAELNLDVRRIDAPLNSHPLYVPAKAAIVARSADLREVLEPGRFALPRAAEAYAQILTFPHQMLLSAPEDMDDVVKALEKVRRWAPVLKARSRELPIHEEV
jgi:L-glutamine:scyllo-inosose aminotransferase/L-glutamine:2-deoxy-scyllo-inosose/3-amino-2,3-dideoxy-scyllo-inosose aminotransferase